MTHPVLIIVTGLPCTGKTTLARALVAHFDLPLIDKDSIKEGLFDLFGNQTLDQSHALSTLTYQVMFSLLGEMLQEGESMVVEANFTRPEHTRLFLELQKEHPFEPRQVLCYARREVLLGRFKQRTRHPGHLDRLLYAELEAELSQASHPALHIGGRLVEVDTSDFARVDVAQICASLSPVPPRK